jgi:membrane protein implicated in regulation of membrane protease activity
MLRNRLPSLADLFAVLFVVVGVAAVVAGVALWSIPAALVVAGMLSLFAAYVVRYLEVQAE